MRQSFFRLLAVGGLGYWVFDRQSRELERVASLPVMVTVAGFDDAGRPTGLVQRLRIHRSDSEWRKRLAVDEFQMTRRADTELAGRPIGIKLSG